MMSIYTYVYMCRRVNLHTHRYRNIHIYIYHINLFLIHIQLSGWFICKYTDADVSKACNSKQEIWLIEKRHDPSDPNKRHDSWIHIYIAIISIYFNSIWFSGHQALPSLPAPEADRFSFHSLARCDVKSSNKDST